MSLTSIHQVKWYDIAIHMGKNWLHCNFIGHKESRLTLIGRAAAKQLDELECIAVQVGKNAKQSVDWNQWMNKAIDVKNQLDRCSSKVVQAAKFSLDRRIVAIKYRLNDSTSLETPENNPYVDQLIDEALQFKKEHFPLDKQTNKELKKDQSVLTDEDRSKLQQTVEYPAFLELLRKDPALRYAFFKWTIRDNNDSKIFIEFPNIQTKISKSALSSRLGKISRLGHAALKIETIDGGKAVTMPIVKGGLKNRFVVRVNILDGNQMIQFNEKLTLKVDTLFREFAKRKKGENIDFEVFQDGIHAWNPNKYAYWNGEIYEEIDFKRDDWYKQLPVFETLSQKDAQERFGKLMNGKNWALVPCATRESKLLDFSGNHAYMQIVIPNSDGSYNVYPFGKFPAKMPVTKWQLLKVLGNTVPAIISYLDQNVYFSQRQKGEYVIPLKPKTGTEVMNWIKKDILLSLVGVNDYQKIRSFFQLQGDNCGKWVQVDIMNRLFNKVNREAPNLYRVKLLDTEPQNFIQHIYHFVRKLPPKWQSTALHAITFVFAPWRTLKILDSNGNKRSVSVMGSEAWKESWTYSPGYLPRLLEEGKLLTIDEPL